MQRHLGLVRATALVVGQVIAVGIFLTPAGMARLLASPFWLLVVWLVAGLMAVCGAIVYGELAARYPDAGGGYVYLRESWGPRTAFLYGWKCCLVMDPGITAALATGFAAYLGYLVPMGGMGLRAAAVVAIATGALVNVAGARLGAGVITALAGLKLGALATIVVAGFLLGRGDWSHFVPLVDRPDGAAPLGAALAGAFVSAFFAFGGWWEAAKLSGEVRDPARTMPRALALGVGVVTLTYVLTSAAFVYLVPLDAVTSDEAFAALAGEALFGKAGGVVLASVVLVSVAGSLLAVQMMLPRLYYAMGRDGVFPAGFGRLHPTRGTPVRAILLQAILASALVAVGTFDAIIAYFIFVTVGFVGLTVAGAWRRNGLIWTGRIRSGLDGLGRVGSGSDGLVRGSSGWLGSDGSVRGSSGWSGSSGWLLRTSAAVFLALVGVLLLLIAINRPVEAVAGIAIVLAGFPVYAVIERRRLNQPDRRDQPELT
jgi:APA family basic amino acid/polyamine antiporter